MSKMLKLPGRLRLNPGSFSTSAVGEEAYPGADFREFGIDYSEQNSGKRVKVPGFSPQKPACRVHSRGR
jgi:hypothetical protein